MKNLFEVTAANPLTRTHPHAPAQALQREQADELNRALAVTAAAQAAQGEVAVFALAVLLKERMEAVAATLTPQTTKASASMPSRKEQKKQYAAAAAAAAKATTTTAAAAVAVAGGAAAATSSSDEEGETTERKTRMRPAQDVVNRLK